MTESERYVGIRGASARTTANTGHDPGRCKTSTSRCDSIRSPSAGERKHLALEDLARLSNGLCRSSLGVGEVLFDRLLDRWHIGGSSPLFPLASQLWIIFAAAGGFVCCRVRNPILSAPSLTLADEHATYGWQASEGWLTGAMVSAAAPQARTRINPTFFGIKPFRINTLAIPACRGTPPSHFAVIARLVREPPAETHCR